MDAVSSHTSRRSLTLPALLAVVLAFLLLPAAAQASSYVFNWTKADQVANGSPFGGSADPGATIDVYRDGSQVDTLTADPDTGYWTTYVDLHAGDNTIAFADGDGQFFEENVV